jgi:hypothetical protein
MKSIEATFIALLVGFAVVTEGHAGDYYFYKGPKGELVISNKEPPPGSKIIKEVHGATDREVPQAQEHGKAQPIGQTESPPKPSTNK